MIVFWRILYFVTFTFLFFSCKKDNPPVAVVNYLFATPNSVTLSIGSDTTVTLSGGTPPYVIVRDPKVNVASAMWYDATTVTIHGSGAGGSSVTLGDNAAIQNTAIVQIVVTALQ